MPEPEFEKILFRYYSNVLEEETIETMWAEVINREEGLFKLNNIPFYGPPVASEDIIHAEFDLVEQSLTFRGVIKSSGNSIIQVVIMREDIQTEEVRTVFKQLGCPSEGMNEKYFSMEVPQTVDYRFIKEKLDELQLGGIIDYAEPCLSDVHAEQIRPNLGTDKL